jgi:hypothetical protein
MERGGVSSTSVGEVACSLWGRRESSMCCVSGSTLKTRQRTMEPSDRAAAELKEHELATSDRVKKG